MGIDDFKRDETMQITRRGYPVRKVSDRLGVSAYSLDAWKERSVYASSSKGSGDVDIRCLVWARSSGRGSGAAGRIELGGSIHKLLRPGLWALMAMSVAGAATADQAKSRQGAFDAVGQIACSQRRGQAMARCDAVLARGAAGVATVVVTFANGFSRTLFFEAGAFVRGNPTMSGTGRDTDWRIARGIHLIRVDDQRYEIPEDLLRIASTVPS